MFRSSPSPSPAAGGSSASSLARAAPLVDTSVFDVGRRVTELEIENAKLTTRVVVAEREVAQKDHEIKRLLVEQRAAKTSLEKVIKDLIEKNKSIEAECKRRIKLAEDAVQRATMEHSAHSHSNTEVRHTLAEWRHALHAKEVEVEHWRTAHEQLARQEQHLQLQFDELHQHVERLEEELDQTRMKEADTQQDLDAALSKLEKADEHIHKLSAEAEANAVELVRLKHLCDATEMDATLARDELGETEERLLRVARHAAGETDRLSMEVDELLDFVKATALKKRNDSTPHSVESDKEKRLFLVSPERNKNSPQPSTQQSCVQLMRRLADAVSLVREDIAVSRRAIIEISLQSKDSARRAEVVSEVVHEERQIALEAAQRSQALEDALAEEREKVKRLESSMTESSRWMEEAAALGEESSRRTERLVKENGELQSEVRHHRDECSKLQRQLASAIADAERQGSTVQRLERDVSDALERLRSAERRYSTAENDVEELRARVTEKDKVISHQELALSRMEAEKSFAAKQHHDFEERLRSQVKQNEANEATISELRTKLFESQKRLDQLLRHQGAAAPAMSTPPRQRSVTGRDASPGPNASRSGHTSEYRNRLPTGRAPSSATPAEDASRGASGTNAPSVADKVRSWEDRLNSLLNATKHRVV